MILSANTELTDSVPGAPPSDNTLDTETIDPQKPHQRSFPKLTAIQIYKNIVGVDNVGEISYGKATGLYNKHHKHSEQYNLSHLVGSAQNFNKLNCFDSQ